MSVGQRQDCTVVGVDHFSIGNHTVLDLEQVGEVGVDLQHHTERACLVEIWVTVTSSIQT